MSTSPSTFRKTVRDLLPPFVLRAGRRLFGWRWFRGCFSAWPEARAEAGGYDQPAILEKVKSATLAVRAGRAAYERDSVLFAEPCADHALLAALLHVAAALGGRLNLIDFGGSLGTTYWQHRIFLPPLAEIHWDVVEQSHFVEAGRREIETGPLRFFSGIDEAEQSNPHGVLLASGVVHCLEQPHAFMDELAGRGFEYLVFNNVPLHETGPDHLRVEHVPPHIYAASYPVWFFNRAGFLAHFADRYDLVYSYASAAVWPVGWGSYPSTGLLLRRKGRQ